MVPGTRHRIGLDPLIGLIPFAGDAITAVMAAWIIIESTRFGIPAQTAGTKNAFASPTTAAAATIATALPANGR